MATIHDGNGNAITKDNPLATTLEGGNVILPVDIQSRLASTVQTLNAVAVNFGTTSTSSTFIDTDGFDSISITARSSASHSGRMQILWSNDGSSIDFWELPTTTLNSTNSGTMAFRGFTLTIKARYFKVYFENQDASVNVTASVWAYLKA